jgi:hypothetical protein
LKGISLDQHDAPQDASERTVGTRVVEVVVALMFMGIAGVVMADSLRVGARWGDFGPEAGYFPFYVGLIMFIASTGTLIAQFTGRGAPASANFVERSGLWHVLQVLLPTIAFVVAIGFIGIYVAGLIYLTLFMWWLGGYPFYKSIPLSLAVMGVLFWLFEIAFLVPLPKGPVEAALGF